jgi:hypothetical protein
MAPWRKGIDLQFTFAAGVFSVLRLDTAVEQCSKRTRCRLILAARINLDVQGLEPLLLYSQCSILDPNYVCVSRDAPPAVLLPIGPPDLLLNGSET